MYDDQYNTFNFDEMDGADAAGLLFFIILGAGVLYFAPFYVAGELGYEVKLDVWIESLNLYWKILYYIGHMSASFLILVSVVAVICTSLKLLFDGLCIVAEWLFQSIKAAIETFVAYLIWFTRLLINTAINIALYPFRLLVRIPLNIIAFFLVLYEERREIRRMFREEYAADFKSFRQFKKYWKAVQRGEEPPYPGEEEEEEYEEPGKRPDLYQEALALFGLKEPFTKAEFKARYRQLMKKYHPDITGDNQAAQRINAACAIIKQRKAWK